MLLAAKERHKQTFILYLAFIKVSKLASSFSLSTHSSFIDVYIINQQLLFTVFVLLFAIHNFVLAQVSIRGLGIKAR